MQSSVGNPQIYEDGDQKTSKGASQAPYNVGPEHSHNNLDSKDERSLANRLAAAERDDKNETNSKTVTDPLGPARAHGNEPSRGAKIDADLQAQEEEELRRKGKI